MQTILHQVVYAHRLKRPLCLRQPVDDMDLITEIRQVNGKPPALVTLQHILQDVHLVNYGHSADLWSVYISAMPRYIRLIYTVF